MLTCCGSRTFIEPPDSVKLTSTPWCSDVASAFTTTFPQLPLHQHVVYFGECVLTVAFGVQPPPGLVITATLCDVPESESITTAREFFEEVVKQRRLGGDPNRYKIVRMDAGPGMKWPFRYHLPASNTHMALTMPIGHCRRSITDFLGELSSHGVPSDELVFDGKQLLATQEAASCIKGRTQQFNLDFVGQPFVNDPWKRLPGAFNSLLRSFQLFRVTFTVDAVTLFDIVGSYGCMCQEATLGVFERTATQRSMTVLFYPGLFNSRDLAMDRVVSLLLQCGLLELDWRHIIFAGGAVLSCLDPEFKNRVEVDTMDLDFFIYGAPRPEEVVQKFLDVVRVTRPDVEVVVSSTAITILGVYPIRHVQIILCNYESPSQIFHLFDLACCRFGYNGRRFVGTQTAQEALITRVMLCTGRRLTRTRHRKYAERGFTILHICRATGNLISIGECGLPSRVVIPVHTAINCGCRGFEEIASIPTIPWGPGVTKYNDLAACYQSLLEGSVDFVFKPPNTDEVY